MKRCILITFLICACVGIGAKNYVNIRLGLDGVVGASPSKSLNVLANNWLEYYEEVNNLTILDKDQLYPTNLDFGLSQYVSVILLQTLQLGLRAYEMKSPHTFSLLFADSLRITASSHIPSVFASLRISSFELGAGIIQSYSQIDINDKIIGYAATWKSKDYGYELSLSFSANKNKRSGFTSQLVYRNLTMANMTDQYGRPLVIESSGQPYTVDYTGYFLRLGYYFDLFSYN